MQRQRSFMTTRSNFHQINAFKLSANENRLSNDDGTYSKGSKRSMRKYQIVCENPKHPYYFYFVCDVSTRNEVVGSDKPFNGILYRQCLWDINII